ncbi:hypothetical protein Q4F19_17790 [Sphingomonas sp. BIUV-7]|uniref:Uncharacterized protein n=1 Tax=Sphingomonas natans TaxID=3063330 RepID=A0ABT8YD34_9SPHN|nr:hypothetical protein [Sphingomonas sp. BIUV-7]MDO6416243.1 hypothetical protein [Sphingomonas sp. BIUV-7]
MSASSEQGRSSIRQTRVSRGRSVAQACLLRLARRRIPSTRLAASYPRLYLFGDSLVDVGNAFSGSKGIQANPTNSYSDLCFNNGLIFRGQSRQRHGAPANMRWN